MTIITPEVHHDRLMTEIDYELDTYGVVSIAGIVASMLDARCDSEDNSPTAEHYRAARRLFEELENRLAKLPRPFNLPVNQEQQAKT